MRRRAGAWPCSKKYTEAQGREYVRRFTSGCTLRAADAAQVTGIRRAGGADAGAGDRRKLHNILGGQWSAAAPVAVFRARANCARIGKQSPERVADLFDFATEFP